MKKKEIIEAGKIISNSSSIAIAGHVNPDGDCIGSLLALGIGLINYGKKVEMVLQDPIPEKYRQLPYAGKIKKDLKKVPDLAVTVDCNAREMVGRPFRLMGKAHHILEIDHHEYRRSFGDISLIDTASASVGEMVYGLLKHMKIDITAPIAQNILTSIIVETNSFRLPTVKPETFSTCSRLLKTGVDYHRLSELVYWSKTIQEAVLSALCMKKTVFLENNRIAWSYITLKEFARAKGKDENVDAVADDMRMIDTVKIAILFREKDARTLRVSLRSKNGINIASLARKYGGGGHFDCAGCQIPNAPGAKRSLLEDAKKLL